MVLSGVTVDIGCFTGNAAAGNQREFVDRFSFFSELSKLSISIWSFGAEIGIREAFGSRLVLCRAIAGFRELFLTPRLFTTGCYFSDRLQSTAELEQVSDAGAQQIFLRVNAEEAAALSSRQAENLVEGCQAGGIDLRLQFEMQDSFTEDCYRIARTVEERQFTVTVLPTRLRPLRSVALSEAPVLDRTTQFQLLLDASGNVRLQTKQGQEVLSILAGNVQECPLHELIKKAGARS